VNGIYEVGARVTVDRINQRINECAEDGGGRVVLPAGRFELSGRILFPAVRQPLPYKPVPSVELAGAGIGATILEGEGLGIDVNRSYTRIADLAMEYTQGIRVYPEATAPVVRNLRLERVAITDTSGIALQFYRGSYEAVILSTIADCAFGGNAGGPIVRIGLGCTTLRFERSSFTEFAVGVELSGARGISFDRCHWEGNRGAKPYLAIANCEDVSVCGAWFEESHLDPGSPWFVYVDGAIGSRVSGTFVRKSPKARVMVVGPSTLCTKTSLDGMIRIVGTWDGDAPVWEVNGSCTPCDAVIKLDAGVVAAPVLTADKAPHST